MVLFFFVPHPLPTYLSCACLFSSPFQTKRQARWHEIWIIVQKQVHKIRKHHCAKTNTQNPKAKWRMRMKDDSPKEWKKLNNPTNYSNLSYWETEKTHDEAPCPRGRDSENMYRKGRRNGQDQLMQCESKVSLHIKGSVKIKSEEKKNTQDFEQSVHLSHRHNHHTTRGRRRQNNVEWMERRDT